MILGRPVAWRASRSADFRRFGAGVGEEDGIDATGHELAQALAELHQPRIDDRGVLGMNHGGHLLLRGLHDLGVAMAGTGDTDTRGKIHIGGHRCRRGRCLRLAQRSRQWLVSAAEKAVRYRGSWTDSYSLEARIVENSSLFRYLRAGGGNGELQTMHGLYLRV